jgi:glycosyltransferase involved in cell wall biosynthesis
MRILLWHGWLLEGSGSNVVTAKLAESFRAAGLDVLLLCQEPHPERYAWIDAYGSVGAAGPSALTPGRATPSPGRCVLLRPRIGRMLPVFVVDRYEGFDEVLRFVDLSDEQLERYLRANVEALRAAAEWHASETAVVGHAIPGAAIGRRALGPNRYVAKIHGSDIEYAIRIQDRYRELAHEGLETARAVVGATADVLERCSALVPGTAGSMRTVPPGVDVASFRPRPAADALRETARLVEEDPATALGRPASVDADVGLALDRRDAGALGALAAGYDHDVPEPDAATRLRALSERDVPVVGYLGKLIPQKGVELLLAGHHVARHDAAALIVGFGSYREWLAALEIALRSGDAGALAWLHEVGGMPIQPALGAAARSGERTVTFTGRLDHRYAPGAVAAMDVLAVPSILPEAFGMVAAEGAATGAFPLVARHSGLAEVAGVLETETGRPGLFSFEPGPGAAGRLAAGIDRLLSLPAGERDELRQGLSGFVAREWSWERTAARYLELAAPG